jgi:hypothetical protein
VAAGALEKERAGLNERVESLRRDLHARMTHASHLSLRGKDICLALLESGHLRAAQQLIDSNGEDTPLGPESIPLLRPWTWAESPEAVLLWHTNNPRLRPPSFGGWMPQAAEAKALLRSLQDLADGLGGAAGAVATALNRFLGVQREIQNEIRAVSGGSLAKLHNLFGHLPTERFHPTGSVDLFVAERGVTQIPAELDGLQTFVAVGPSLREPEPSELRGDVAVIGLRDMLRLVLQEEYRSVYLLRILGAQWPLAALSAGSAEQLRQLLEDDPGARWRTISWIVHLTGLGGPKVTDAVAFQTGLDAELLDLLLNHLVRAREQHRRYEPEETIRLWLRDQHLLSAVESCVLNPIRHSPAAVLAFWTALSAVAPGEPFLLEDLTLALEISSAKAVPEQDLRDGLSEIAGLSLASGGVNGSIVFRRCGALIALRSSAAARAADAAQALIDQTDEPQALASAMTAWEQHGHALSPALTRYLELRDVSGAGTTEILDAHEEVLRQTASLAESIPDLAGTVDVVSVLEGMRRDFDTDHDGIDLVVDTPVVLNAAVRAEFLRYVIHALLENAAESLYEIGEGMIQVSARASYGDVMVDVRDSGPGIDLSSDQVYRVFRSGFSTRGPDRGQGLYMSRRLTQNIGGDLELVTTRPAHPILGGAHFRLIVPAA